MNRTVNGSGSSLANNGSLAIDFGPHLPLHNDELISRGLARELVDEVWPGQDVLVGGRLEMGVDPCPGPGSRGFSHDAVKAAVVQAADTLWDLGAKKLVVMTFHGLPLHEHELEAGCERFRRRGGRALNPMNVVMDTLITVDGRRFAPAVAHVADEHERLALLDAIPLDFHGGFFETSLTLHHAPASVAPDWTSLKPCPPLPLDPALARREKAARRLGKTRLADELRVAAYSQGWATIRPFPGYTSAPHRATPQAGAYFAERLRELIAPVLRAVLEDGRRAPKPVMEWVLWATLGGRMDAAKPLELAHVGGH